MSSMIPGLIVPPALLLCLGSPAHQKRWAVVHSPTFPDSLLGCWVDFAMSLRISRGSKCWTFVVGHSSFSAAHHIHIFPFPQGQELQLPLVETICCFGGVRRSLASYDNPNRPCILNATVSNTPSPLTKLKCCRTSTIPSAGGITPSSVGVPLPRTGLGANAERRLCAGKLENDLACAGSMPWEERFYGEKDIRQPVFPLSVCSKFTIALFIRYRTRLFSLLLFSLLSLLIIFIRINKSFVLLGHQGLDPLCPAIPIVVQY